MTNIHLCSIPFLSTSYTNVIDFENADSRELWFTSKTLKTVQTNFKYDNQRAFIVINENFEEAKLYDYLWFNKNGRGWFYFITAHEIVTENNTRLYVELDVFTSYMFSYSFMPTFIDRMHVPRWNGDIPTYNLEDEEVEIGEYIQTEKPIDLYTMKNSTVVATTVPIGYVTKPNGYGGGSSSGGSSSGGSNNGTSWKNGKLSSKGFRFIKGFEGFAPSKYQDSGGYWTIAYGVTAHGESTLYNQLVSESPITEERAARVSYDLKNSNYGAKILDSVKKLGCDKQYQFDALCSLAYNCGNGVVTGYNNLMEAISNDPTNESVIRPIWEKFYITSNGQQLAGLVARRKQECNMFFNQEFEVRPIGIVNSSGSISGTVTENNGDGWLPDEENIGEIDGYKNFTNDYGTFMCPVKGGTVSSKYGWRIHPVYGTKDFHHGTDISVPTGSPSVSCQDGVVLQAGWQNPNNHSEGYGLRVWVQHGDYKVVHAHLSKIVVEEGQTVKQGQKIGEVGSTGTSTGPHCHWEIRRISDNESVDPAPSLNKGDVV